MISLIVSIEGYYIIRTLKFGLPKIKILDEDYFIDTYQEIFFDIQNKAIKKFKLTNKIKKNIFYEKIIKDDFMKDLNNFLKKYNIYIDFYPRIYNKKLDKYIVSKLDLKIISFETT